MQRVSVICVGKLKERFYTEAAAEYLKRLSRYCKAEVIELPEERLPEAPSPAQIEAALSREADAVRGKLPQGCLLIALCWPPSSRRAPSGAGAMWSSSSAPLSACTPASRPWRQNGSPSPP